jgi:hypothetical protein
MNADAFGIEQPRVHIVQAGIKKAPESSGALV